MALVIFEGRQYDDDRLPSHVDPKQCVPLAEWFAANRRVRTRPQAAKPAVVKPATKPADARPAKRSAKKS